MSRLGNRKRLCFHAKRNRRDLDKPSTWALPKSLPLRSLDPISPYQYVLPEKFLLGDLNTTGGVEVLLEITCIIHISTSYFNSRTSLQ